MPKVLIAEDEVEIRFLYTRWLGRAGYETVEVDRGDEVLASFMADDFDMVILDVMMPGMGGYDVCALIRESGTKIPIVMMSALTRPKDVQRGMDAGASLYVNKASSEERLLSIVKSALNGDFNHEIE